MEYKSKKPNPKRRAIIQGSLAAPVVLTVPSAGAQTNTTLGRCLANLDKGPQPAFFVADSSADKWLRVQVDIYKLYEPNGDVICPRAFIDDALKAANPLDAYKAWRSADSPYGQVSFTTNQINNLRSQKIGTARGLQWVDELSKTKSNKIQIESPGSGYRHATGTCWSSFVTGA